MIDPVMSGSHISNETRVMSNISFLCVFFCVIYVSSGGKKDECRFFRKKGMSDSMTWEVN